MKSLKKDQIYQQLLNDIDSGKLKKGSKLPPERELSKNLGVSIVTLRSALGRLEQSGKIERIRSQGTFVCKAFSQVKNTTGRIMCLLRPHENNAGAESYFNEIIDSVHSEIMKNSSQVIQPPISLALKAHNPSNEVVKNIISTIEDAQDFVDGFILDENIPDTVLEHFENLSCKSMQLINRHSDFRVDSLAPALEPGIEKLVDLTLKLNYEKFVICRIERNAKHQLCFNKIIKELKKESVAPRNIKVINGLSDDTLAEFMQNFNKEIKTAKNQKTVFFAGHESLAKFIHERLKRKGFTIGKQIGIAGYFLSSENNSSQISSLLFSPRQLGEHSVSMLFERINDNIYNLSRREEIPATLHVGESL